MTGTEKKLEDLGILPEDFQMKLDKLLRKSMSDEYSGYIANGIMNDVIDDIYETADHEDWNDDDLTLAVGRGLMDKLSMEVY